MQFPPRAAHAIPGYPTPAPNCAATPNQSSTPVPLPTCEPCSTPPVQDWPSGYGYVDIDTDYQPSWGTKLAWIPYPPTVETSDPPPGVLVFHGGSWYAGSAIEVSFVCEYLAARGYYAFAVEYELSRCGYIKKQPCHEHDYDGTLPDMVTRQTDDAKALVVALRASGLVDPNKIGVVGGSAGGGHAIVLGVDRTPSGHSGNDWPFWFKDGVDTRPQCVVALSGVFKFGDRTPPPGYAGPIDSNFVLGTQNYVNSATVSVLDANSPIGLLTSANSPFQPMYLINSWFDHPPSYHQMVDMMCKLNSFTPTPEFQTLTIPNSDLHSFHYWSRPDGIPGSGEEIRDHVVDFLDAHLK